MQRFAIFIAAFFAVWTIRAIWLLDIDQSIRSSETRTAYATLVKALLWVLPAVLFAHWVRRRDPIQYLGLSDPPKIKTWAISIIAIGLYCALTLCFEVIVGHKKLSLESQSAAGLTSMVAFFVVSPFIEELFFRGLVLGELASSMRPMPANIVASFLFVGIHLPYWISSGTQPLQIARDSAGVFLFSLFAGWLCFLGKSIWPPTAGHIANNILSSLIKMG